MALLYAFPGFLTGDDVELLEAAARQAYGLPYEPWAIRNLFVPYVFVGPWLMSMKWLLALPLNLRSTQFAIWPIVGVSAASSFQVFKLGLRWGLTRRSALLAAWFFGFHWAPLVYGSSAYTRPLATSLILGAVSLATIGGSFRRLFVSGILVAVAFACRYSEAICLLPLVGLVASCVPPSRWVKEVGGLAAGFGIGVALLVGGFDFLTWGRPFASLIEFARYVFVEHASSSLQAGQPWYWYLWRLPHWLPLSLLPLVFLGCRQRPGRHAAMFVVGTIASLSFIYHKELRYLQVAIPFLAIWAAAGLEPLLKGRRPIVAGALVALTLAFGVQRAWALASKRSGAAVEAAQLMGSHDPHRVVLSQAWAYGDLMFLTDRTSIADLPPVPSREELRRSLTGADYVALYEDAIVAQPRLATTLKDAGYRRIRTFITSDSRSVAVFMHAAPAS